MFDWIRNLFSSYRDRIKTAREVQPGNFRKMAEEITELADACAQVCPPESEILNRIERVKEEMDQLRELTSQPEFRKLSVQRKLELKESLVQSREQILDSMQTAPTPTRFLQ